MAKPILKLVEPSNENRTVIPKPKPKRPSSAAVTRPPNADLRSREYLTPSEVDKLIAAAKEGNRYGRRDATMLLVIYRHGLRASEACELEWSQVDFETATMHVRRAKNGKPSAHPIRGDELRALRQLKRGDGPSSSTFVFVSERRVSERGATPFTPDAVNRMVKRLGPKAGLAFPVHVHMLRHACGYKLANDGHDTRAIQDYLGHKAIQHTVRYTELTQTRFKDFWR